MSFLCLSASSYCMMLAVTGPFFLHCMDYSKVGSEKQSPLARAIGRERESIDWPQVAFRPAFPACR